MLLSTAEDLRFHFFPQTQDDIIYKPSIPSKVTYASWSKDNSYLVYQCDKGKPEIITLKDPKSIKLVHVVAALNDVSAIIFQRTTKKCLGVGTHNGQVALYDTKLKTINKLFENAPSAVRYMDFNTGDQHMAVACLSGNVLLYDVAQGHVCGNYILSEAVEPTALRFHSSSANILAAASEEGTIMLWDTVTANKTFISQTHTSPITGIAFGRHHNDILVSVGEDNKFCVHDLSIRECVFRSSTQHPLSAVDVSGDGTTIAIGSQEGIVYIYDVRNLLTPITSLRAHNSKVSNLLFQYIVKDGSSVIDHSVSDMITRSVCEIRHRRMKAVDVREQASDTSSKLSVTSKRSSSDNMENDFLRKFKSEIVHNVTNDTQQMTNHLNMHMHNLAGFIQTEFHKMDMQMDEKWELLNLASANLSKDNDEIMSYTQSLDPPNNELVILE